MIRIENTSAVEVAVFTINPDGTRTMTNLPPDNQAEFPIGEGVLLSVREYTEVNQPEAPASDEPAVTIGGNE